MLRAWPSHFLKREYGHGDGGTFEAEVATIRQISFDDATAADQLAARRRTHAGTAKSLGSRTRL